MSKIIAHAWLSGNATIGVVITYDPIKKDNPYQGIIGSLPSGMENVVPEKALGFVKELGQKIVLRAAIPIIENHGQWHSQVENMDIYRFAINEAIPKADEHAEAQISIQDLRTTVENLGIIKHRQDAGDFRMEGISRIFIDAAKANRWLTPAAIMTAEGIRKLADLKKEYIKLVPNYNII